MAITKVWLDESENECTVCPACASVIDASVPTVREPKPPLGVIPRWLWLERRYNDIHAAILRYEAAGFDIPANWREERRGLATDLQRERERERERENTRSAEFRYNAK